MRSYRDFPIRTKVQGIVAGICGVTLLAASAGLSFYARSTLLRAKEQELYTTARMVGANSTAALQFRDRRGAESILSAVGANPDVILACEYDERGEFFAKYRRNGSPIDCSPKQPVIMPGETSSGKIRLLQDITLHEQLAGAIFVESDLKDVNSLVVSFLAIGLMVWILCMAVAVGLASILQHIICDPIGKLAATAVSVYRKNDYSIRAQKAGEDEVGDLVEAFNRMLDSIRQRDAKLKEARDELEQRVQERTAHLNAAIEDNKRMEIGLRHAQKLEAVGALAAGIAHEINTPIQFVSDNTRFLRDSFREMSGVLTKYERVCREADKGVLEKQAIDDAVAERKKADWDYLREEVPKALAQAEEGLARVATIVRAMKDFSHSNQTGMAAADLNHAIESTLIVARNELKYVADVECDYGQLPPVVCSLGDLNQVVLNLLINAAHAIRDVVQKTGKRGHIRVRTGLEGAWVEIAISDTGSGIPSEIQDKIFDPFFTTKEVGKGTGQGLAIARSIIVGKHGGTITFETRQGYGTTFYIRLPVDGPPSADTPVNIEGSAKFDHATSTA